MKRQKVEQMEVVTIETICDDCGGKSACRNCFGCDRDICHQCYIFLYTDPFDLIDNGDYPQKICKQCSKILNNYHSVVQKYHKEFDELIETLRAEFIAKCKLKLEENGGKDAAS